MILYDFIIIVMFIIFFYVLYRAKINHSKRKKSIKTCPIWIKYPLLQPPLPSLRNLKECLH